MDRKRRRRAAAFFGTTGLLCLCLALISPVAAQVPANVDQPCKKDPPKRPVDVPPAQGCEAGEPTPEPTPESTSEPTPEPTSEPLEPRLQPVEESGQAPSPSPGRSGRSRSPAAPAHRTTVRATAAFPGSGMPFAFVGGQGSTEGLIEVLLPLEEHGISLDEALLRVAGPFPVAGLAWWTNDWHAPRCCPEPHLHQGLDMFAEIGTPLVAVADGTVSQKRVGAVSGLSVEITDEDGVEYFYAHLSAFADGLEPGQEVGKGDVLGFVGDSGNARGTMPHLHLEVQPGGAPVPPMPYVEEWLEQAERRAVRWVERVTGAAPEPGTQPDAPAAAADRPAAVATAQLLEHPSVPTGGTVPASVEVLDVAARGEIRETPQPSRMEVREVGPAADEPAPWWPTASRSTRAPVWPAGLLPALALLALSAGRVRRRRIRARRLRERPLRVEPGADGVPEDDPPDDPPGDDQVPRSADPAPSATSRATTAELLGAGSALLLIGVAVLLVRRGGRQQAA